MGWLIGSLVMGILGGTSKEKQYKREYKEYLEDAQAQIDEYNRKAEEETKTAELEFETAKDEANKSADKSDKQSTLNEGYASTSFNTGLEQIQQGQNEEGLSFNMQAQANGQNTGNELSAMAASGTRSSSMSQAVDLESAMNAMQLQAAEDSARANDNTQLASLFQNLDESVNTIQTARTDAIDLRNSYLEGGNKYKLYQNQLQNIKDDTAANVSEVNRQVKRAKDNYNLGVTTAFFSGFGTGWTFGDKLYTSIKNHL